MLKLVIVQPIGLVLGHRRNIAVIRLRLVSYFITKHLSFRKIRFDFVYLEATDTNSVCL